MSGLSGCQFGKLVYQAPGRHTVTIVANCWTVAARRQSEPFGWVQRVSHQHRRPAVGGRKGARMGIGGGLCVVVLKESMRIKNG